MNTSESIAAEAQKRDLSDSHGGSPETRSCRAPEAQSVTYKEPVKVKPSSLREEIRKVLLGKARRVTDDLKTVMLESEINKAVESIAIRMADELIIAATKYAQKSAGACKISKQDLLHEILVNSGIATPKKMSRSHEGKKENGDDKKGGRHASGS